jgi:hypothetical protein
MNTENTMNTVKLELIIKLIENERYNTLGSSVFHVSKSFEDIRYVKLIPPSTYWIYEKVSVSCENVLHFGGISDAQIIARWWDPPVNVIREIFDIPEEELTYRILSNDWENLVAKVE